MLRAIRWIFLRNMAYDAFVKRVYETIDWSHLFERMTQMENETIAATIDSLMNQNEKGEGEV